MTLPASDPEPGVGVREMRSSNDGGAWSEWEEYSPAKQRALNVAQGSRSVSVQYRDGVGNESASYTDSVTLDTLAPKVRSVSPLNGSKNASRSANLAAVFSDDMDADTVAGTPASFVLKKAGSTKAVSAVVTYSATTRTATLNPSANLARGATYTAKITSGAEDKAGNPLDQEPAVSGNQAMTWKFKVK